MKASVHDMKLDLRLVSRLVSLLLLLSATAATALGLRTTSTSLARSPDGANELFEDDSPGPEGGGSTAFRVTGRGGAQTFVISNDLSPGDGSRPQRVSEKSCRERLADLKALLDQRGFKGVRVHPGVCARKPREGAVTADGP